MSSSRPKTWAVTWVGCQEPLRSKSPSRTSMTTLQSSHRVSANTSCTYRSTLCVIFFWCDVPFGRVNESTVPCPFLHCTSVHVDYAICMYSTVFACVSAHVCVCATASNIDMREVAVGGTKNNLRNQLLMVLYWPPAKIRHMRVCACMRVC